ncbi:MAG: 50S ribosomal protein L35 [Parcubacteria group bacterium]|nr:50S ribosomal protein L35 [Parcubacteria group bacterium]
MKSNIKLANKRIKVTKGGKLLHRKSGQSHFRAKKARSVLLSKKNTVEVSDTVAKAVRSLL